jgi:F0F1-type ATP synthase assembly protein I
MPPDEKDGDAPGSKSGLRGAGPYLGLGSTLAGTLLVTVGAGYWLDKKFGTHPILFLVGAGLGLAAAAYHIYKMYLLMIGRDR